MVTKRGWGCFRPQAEPGGLARILDCKSSFSLKNGSGKLFQNYDFFNYNSRVNLGGSASVIIIVTTFGTLK